MSGDRIDVVFGAQIDPLRSGIASATGAIKTGAEQIEGALGKVRAAFSMVAEIAALGLIGDKFREMVGHVAELGESLVKAGQKVGESVENLSRLRFAAELSDVSFDSLTLSLTRLSRAMSEAAGGTVQQAAAFKAIGVSVTDAAGHLRPVNDVLFDIADRFAGYADGAQKAAIAMALFGRSGAELIPFLDQGRSGIQALMQESDRLGITMSTETARAAQEFGDTMKKLRAQIEGITVQIVGPYLDALTRSAEAMSATAEKASALVQIIQLTVEVILDICRAIDIVIQLLKYMESALEVVGGTIATVFGEGVRAIVLAMTGNFSAAFEIIKQFPTTLARQTEEARATFSGSAQRMADDLEAIFAPWLHKRLDIQVAPLNQHSEAFGYTPIKTAAPGLPGSGGPSQVDQYRAELQAKLQAEGKYLEDSKAEELAFWQEKLAQVQKGSNDELAIRKEIYDLKKALAQKELQDQIADLRVQQEQSRENLAEQVRLADQNAQLMARNYGADSTQYKQALADKLRAERAFDDEQRRLTLQRLEANRQADQAQMQLEQEHVGFLQQIGQLSESEEVARLKRLEEAHYASDFAILQQERRMALLHEQDLHAVDSRIEQLNQQHNQRVQQLNQRAALAVRNQWQSIIGPIRNAISGSVTGILQGTQTAMGAIQNFLTSILASFVDWGAQMLEQWILDQIMAKTVASTTSITAALGQISNSAAVAAAGAYAATAAIPYVGPALAPGAAATAYAGAISFASGLVPFATGAWEIRDVTPSLLHPGEMVIPADFAEGLRGAWGSGWSLPAPAGPGSAGITPAGSAAGDRGGGFNPTIHVHLTSNGRLTKDELMENSRHVAKAVAKELRNFNPDLKPR